MARLIDADAFAQKMKERHDFYIEAWGGFNKLPPDTKARVDEISACWADVYNAPTVDAVEVVRCKDCEHCYKATFSSTGYRCKVWGVYDKDCEVTPEHYCSYGERKDNG